MNPLSEKKREELATEIFEWLVKNELWIDVCIYFNGKRWSTHNRETKEYYYNQHKYYEDEADPRNYFDYVREPENILSMSFLMNWISTTLLSLHSMNVFPFGYCITNVTINNADLLPCVFDRRRKENMLCIP